MNPISSRIWPALMLLSAALGLAACETRPPLRPEAPQPEIEATTTTAESAEKSREFVLAAREYQSLANRATSPQREHFALKSVDALIKAGQVREARERIRSIDVSRLDPGFASRRGTLEAQLAVLEEHPREALALLARAEKASHLNPSISAEIHRVRAQAETALDRPVAAITSLIHREKFIVARDEILRNQQDLWQILGTLSRSRLKDELKSSSDPVLGGWLELAVSALENAGNRSALSIAIANWQKTHPGHPASDDFLNTLARVQPGQIGHIERITLLLPLTSDYAQAAAAVRDGFLAMHGIDQNPDKPRITVIDIGKDPTAAPAYYSQSIRDGAQLVVGPLGLEAVDQVAKNTRLDVPTLLLSHTSNEIDEPGRAIFQFGLPPEQEATQAAERAWLDGRRQAAVLYPDSAWGRRVQGAFVATWQRLGGLVVSEQAYPVGQSDYSDPVKRLLNITQSEARKQRLENLAKMKLKYEPRPREDIDFVFLAADARHARLIKPQLSYHRASRIPVYATSHVFSGRGNPALDADLDGIQFGDMPWMLVGDGRVAELRARLQAGWPHAQTGLDRLFALGIDAYAILPQLNRLSSENAVRFGGVTSGLSLGRGGRLHRQLLWAQFRKGVPTLIDTFFGHKSQFDIDSDPAPARSGGG